MGARTLAHPVKPLQHTPVPAPCVNTVSPSLFPGPWRSGGFKDSEARMKGES
jgi:hypothetical protein